MTERYAMFTPLRSLTSAARGLPLVLSLGASLLLGSGARADIVDDFLGGGGAFADPPWFDISPNATGDFDWNNDLINLTPNTDEQLLHSGDYSGGFQVTRRRKVEAGIGPSFDFQGIPLGITPFVGILPIVGVEAVEQRYAASEDDAKNLPAIRASILPRYLKTWRAGDNISYRAAGGILFSAGLSIYGFGASARYLARGDWIVYVEKLEGAKAYVKITKTSLHSFGMSAGAAIIGISLDTFRNTDNYFSYTIDLDDARAVSAFGEILFGNLTTAQAMAEEEGSPIELDLSARVEQVGRRTRFWYGLSWLLGGEISGGKLTTYENEWRHQEGVKVKVNTGVIFDEKVSRVFLRKQREIEAFYGTAQLMRPADDEEAAPFRNYSGSYFWSYENTRTDGGHIRHAIKHLIKKTGLRRELWIEAPSQNKLKYTLTQFQFTLSKGAMEMLLELARDTDDLALIDRVWRNQINAYFAGGNDPDEVCRKSQSRSGCIADYREDTAEAIGELKRKLARMAELAGEEGEGFKDQKEFVRAFAEFGKQMTKNRFTFQTVLKLVEGSPVTMSLVIEGRKVLRLKREIGYNLDERDRLRDAFIQWQINNVPTTK